MSFISKLNSFKRCIWLLGGHYYLAIVREERLSLFDIKINFVPFYRGTLATHFFRVYAIETLPRPLEV